MTETPLAYRLEHVERRYGTRVALSLDELTVAPGELLCLLGPTGAGKSTLLRLLAGLDAADAGRILLGDVPIHTAATNLRRRVTLVFQKPLLLSGSVRANVEYGLRLRGDPDAGAKTRAMLARLGLAGLEARSARTLSGGETQLVALARALVFEPLVLLLDEPTANLDPSRVALVESVLTDEHRRRRCTVVWATHNLFQARRVAGRVALLLEGRLVEAAPAGSFFESPSDPRTIAFVEGRMVY